MVVEEKKKDQHKHGFRRVCQGLHISPTEKFLLSWFVPKEAQFWIETEISQDDLKSVVWAELTGNTLQSKESSLARGAFFILHQL